MLESGPHQFSLFLCVQKPLKAFSYSPKLQASADSIDGQTVTQKHMIQNQLVHPVATIDSTWLDLQIRPEISELDFSGDLNAAAAQ